MHLLPAYPYTLIKDRNRYLILSDEIQRRPDEHIRQAENTKIDMATNYHHKETRHYLIQIQGNLPKRWSGWFSGMQIKVHTRNDGEKVTSLEGQLPDQAALFGVLERIRDLGLTLLLVQIQEQ